MALPYGTGFSPLLGEPRMGLIPLPARVAAAYTLTTAGGVQTVTAADCLGGLFIINCDDAQTMTLPTATLLAAAIPSCKAGVSFEFDVINVGDTTLTVAVGTGGTLVAGNSKSTVATIVALASKRFIVVFTSVNGMDGGTSNAYTVYGLGSVAAAVA